ncbi:replication/maintenance protein RepL [Streptomyces sp. NBC_00439]|uniref:replication/maintenance protein RepL n=1 Tax=Streptomyces sp. NBC_00439 TaxID=2903650 RepID=UPI00224FE915|nr:replication/maintenance protein RepL [Streptomyces sp. NBC_00439]MCX5103041.1 replication/maintenance protein RepL [Streptomyces sp. NBC_00439]MCX5106668.1 replication/maintenance protein RepL [Streptomyces sp. NBC_00439]
MRSANVEYTYQAPHNAWGRSGYSMVSNAFLSDVLAALIARYGMSPVQSAVLLLCMGRQVEGRLKITHIEVARHLGVERANVTRALGSLENWHMLQRRANSLIVVNPLICFKGNGDLQQEALEKLRQDARAALRKHFPEMREDVGALEKAASESFPEFTAPAAPAPRTRQLAFGDNDVEEEAC